MNVKPGSTYSKRQAFKGSTSLAKHTKEKPRFKLHTVMSVGETSRRQRMEASSEGGEGPEGAVAHRWNGKSVPSLLYGRVPCVEKKK